MNSQTTTIEVDQTAAAILRILKIKAEAQGVSLSSLLLPLAEDSINSYQARATDLVDWLKAHSASGVIADDSRESIYTREDEAL